MIGWLLLALIGQAIDRPPRPGPPRPIPRPRAAWPWAEFFGLAAIRFWCLPYAIWLFAHDIWKGFR
jgi:hypothetical protein